MSTFLQCPLRFYAQSVAKEMPWKPSKSKLRGTRVHSSIEKCVRLGWQPNEPWDSDLDMHYVRDRVDESTKLRDMGYSVLVEHEMAINNKGDACTWWDENGLLRAKADIVMLPGDLPEDMPIRLIDIKTGRKWDEDDFQLRVECLLAHLIYKRPVVRYEYWYVDDGDTVFGDIDFRNGLMPVQDIYDLMREMLLAMRNNDYPAKRNKFCRWCDWHGDKRCR